jgi:hypothetical protein
MLEQEREVTDWDDFEFALKEIQDIDYVQRFHSVPKADPGNRRFLYRGQPDSEWKLTTTLDRYLLVPVPMKDYYRYAFRVKPRIETYLNRIWDVPTPPEYEEWLNSLDGVWFPNFAGYEYLAFLRHHGFPSPFLDWTASPYLAAFFATRDVESPADWMSVYVFLEDIGQGKVTTSEAPNIHSLGPYARIHERHFLQQSQYTICVQRGDDNNLCYARHEDALSVTPVTQQDIIWKLNIHASQRRRFLTRLDAMNINDFSLFGTADSLVAALALKEVWLKEVMIEALPPLEESP